MPRSQSTAHLQVVRETPPGYSVVLMGEVEARTLTEAIRATLVGVEARLAEMHAREGWRALGYASWRDWATQEFPEWSQKTLYRRLATGQKALPDKAPAVLSNVTKPRAGARGGRPLGARDQQPRTTTPPAPSLSPGLIPCPHCQGSGVIPRPVVAPVKGRLTCTAGCGYSTTIGQAGVRCPRCKRGTLQAG